VPAAPSVAAYATALIVWLIVLAAGREPTLWKGRAVLCFNGAFIGALLAVILVRQQRPGAGLYILGALLLASAVAARNALLLLHIDRGKIDQVLEKCFGQTRASHKKTPTGYTVIAAGAEMSVAITPLLAAHAVRFSGTKNSKKAQLIRALIAKQFQPSFPVLRIRT
jgi:predicted outer membrane lipoprotein